MFEKQFAMKIGLRTLGSGCLIYQPPYPESFGIKESRLGTDLNFIRQVF